MGWTISCVLTYSTSVEGCNPLTNPTTGRGRLTIQPRASSYVSPKIACRNFCMSSESMQDTLAPLLRRSDKLVLLGNIQHAPQLEQGPNMQHKAQCLVPHTQC